VVGPRVGEVGSSTPPTTEMTVMPE